jgi:septal ring factor EnvC (AmiA/AmiB activator)
VLDFSENTSLETELRDKIDAQAARIAELEAENSELKRRLQRAGVFLADIHMTDEDGAE